MYIESLFLGVGMSFAVSCVCGGEVCGEEEVCVRAKCDGQRDVR